MMAQAPLDPGTQAPQSYLMPSTEETVARLQQEKQNLEAQNAQLWRLCDKQRQMIIGLQRDLDRLGQRQLSVTSTSSDTPATKAAVSPIPSPTSQTPAPGDPPSRSKSEGFVIATPSTDRQAMEVAIPPKSAARASLGASPKQAFLPPAIASKARDITALREGTSSPISPALSLRLQQVTAGAQPSDGSRSASAARLEEGEVVAGRLEEGERLAVWRERLRPQVVNMARTASLQPQPLQPGLDEPASSYTAPLRPSVLDTPFGDGKTNHNDSNRHVRNRSEPSPRLELKTMPTPIEMQWVSPVRPRWEEKSPDRPASPLRTRSSASPSPSPRTSPVASSVILPMESGAFDKEMDRPGHARSGSASTLGRGPEGIDPEALRNVSISLITSNHAPSGEVTLTIGIFRKDMRLLRRLNKTYDQLVALSKATPDMGLALPTRQDFRATSGAKADARRATTDLWFQMMVSTLVSTPVSQRTQEYCQGRDVFCAFLASDWVEEMPVTPRRTRQSQQLASLEPVAIEASGTFKEGYLSKRGKTFGGWKARYFTIDGPCMRYFDAPGGVQLGDISLVGAQVGVQTPTHASTAAEDTALHAFLVLEPRRKGTATEFQRHILCANSDSDRDAWLKVLMHYAMRFPDPTPQSQPLPPSTPSSQTPQASQRLSGLKISGPLALQRPGLQHAESNEELGFRAIGYSDTTAAALPMSPGNALQPAGDLIAGTPYEEHFPGGLSDATLDTFASPGSTKGLQNGRNEARKSKKKSFWTFGKHGEQTSPQQTQGAVLAAMREAAANPYSIPPQSAPIQAQASASSGTLFGMPLAEAVALSSPDFTKLPSLVYRCLQYLDHQQVEREEGIYRLSGSSSLIKALRERFNQEIDIDLLSGEPYDIHAVAGMLKLYLRELPSPILTRDLQRDFLELIEMPEEPARMATIKTLVHALPRENFELLQHLTRHLHRIVQHEPINKMSLRNVGIVFSPTLNIPANVFCLFIGEHEQIFGEAHLASTSSAATSSILAGYLGELELSPSDEYN